MGDSDAVQSCDHVGKLLGFVGREEESLFKCGKGIRRAEDKTIRISMREYHQNLQEIYASRSRRNDAHAELTPAETRSRLCLAACRLLNFALT